MSPLFIVGLVFGLIVFIFLIYQCESQQEDQVNKAGGKQQPAAEGEGKKKKNKNKKKKEAKVESEPVVQTLESSSEEEQPKPQPKQEVVKPKAAKNKGK